MEKFDYRTVPGAAGVVLKCFTKVPNAGDAFSAHLASHCFGASVELVGAELQDRTNLLLVGSILQWADRQSIICGAGFISAAVKLATPPRSIHLVRGPRTREMLRAQGIPVRERYADPGVLAPRLFPLVDARSGQLGVVPHYKDLDAPWVEVCRDKGVRVIDPRQSLPAYFEAIQRCEAVLSSSLHGLVFAHAFGRPAVWVELGDRVLGDGFKFLDYYASLGVSDGSVRRLRIDADDDPFAVAALATCPSTSVLVANAEEALQELQGTMLR